MSNYDLFGLQNNSIKQQIFSSPGNRVTWNKPRGCTMVNFVVIGPGGGGGGGFGGAAGNVRSGGGGGGSGGIVRASIPVYLLPDTLYIYVGKGGLGGTPGAPGTIGSSGELTYISILPNNTSAANLILVSGAVAATGGGAAVAGGGSAAAGSGSTIMTSANAILSSWANFVAISGVAGQTGPLAAGTASPALATTFLTGGPSGGGLDAANNPFAGGGITGVTNLVPTIPGGTAGGVTGSNGNGGFSEISSMIYTSATGGGAGTTTGGHGLASPVGCGGPGAGSASTTGGIGGNGGPGLVIITAI